jgi:hypothetical protein
MKSPQILMIVLIALGAVTGSTLATVTYLNRKKSASVIPSPFVQSGRSANRNSTLEPLKEKTPQAKQNSSEFSQFRLRLLEAVKRRDANFIRALVTPQTQWGQSGTSNIDALKIDDAQSNFWQDMEKALGGGCTIEPNVNVAENEPGSDIWMCPNVPEKAISLPEQVAILGQKVNIRSEPSTNGSIVTTLSKELVQFDSETFTNSPQQTQALAIAPDGWTPVILPNGKQGWVQNRLVYYKPRDYRVSFVRSRGQWRLRYFLRGED